jgi:membrane-associated protease RseP (regulator of RpoE activity)
MRTRAFTILLIVLAAMTASAVAGPDNKSDNDASSDEFHVTVSGGHGRLGLGVIQMSSELRTHFGAPGDRGVLIDSVRSGSPAARAGVRVGDIVLDVDGDAARSAVDMLGAMSDRKKGDRVKLAILRNGKRVDVSVTLEDDPGPRWQSFGGEDDKSLPKAFDWMMPRLFRDDSGTRDELDATRRRLDDLERRLKQLERT